MAHDFAEKVRTYDVKLQNDVDFSLMWLNEDVLRGLTKAGFKKPSPIQLEAIPVGRMGKDLLVQAKSGTGKTLVFVIVALEKLNHEMFRPQVMILVPTREIATQICSVVKSVGSAFPTLTCRSFIGGLSVAEDKEKSVTCQIVVGTPGRIKHLISMNYLPTNCIRLLVFDEADRLFEDTFKQDMIEICSTLPHNKQVIATSATYAARLSKYIYKFLRDPHVACLNSSELALQGVIHYAKVVEFHPLPEFMHRSKLSALEEVLKNINFSQCLVFCNGVNRVELIHKELGKWGFSSTSISSAKGQGDRLEAIDKLKRFQCKVLVTSDLTSRGIDAKYVDLVVNFDIATATETYVHRVGRAGRYGSLGVAITIISDKEIDLLKKIEGEAHFKAYKLPEPLPLELIRNPLCVDYVIQEPVYVKKEFSKPDETCVVLDGIKTDIAVGDENSMAEEDMQSVEKEFDIVYHEKQYFASKELLLHYSKFESGVFSKNENCESEESTSFESDVSSEFEICESIERNDLQKKVFKGAEDVQLSTNSLENFEIESIFDSSTSSSMPSEDETDENGYLYRFHIKEQNKTVLHYKRRYKTGHLRNLLLMYQNQYDDKESKQPKSESEKYISSEDSESDSSSDNDTTTSSSSSEDETYDDYHHRCHRRKENPSSVTAFSQNLTGFVKNRISRIQKQRYPQHPHQHTCRCYLQRYCYRQSCRHLQPSCHLSEARYIPVKVKCCCDYSTHQCCLQPSNHRCHSIEHTGCQNPFCAQWFEKFHLQWQQLQCILQWARGSDNNI